MVVPRLSPEDKKLPDLTPLPGTLEKGTSLWEDAWQRLRRNRLAVISLALVGFMVLFCFIGPLLSPYHYAEQDRQDTFASPSLSHPFGTDELGRDVLTRIMVGGRVSLSVGLAAASVSLLIGVFWGATAAYLGGRTATLMMRFVDILYALPFIIFVILLMTLYDRSLILLFAAIGAVEWLTMARIVYGQVRTLKRREFVEAAESLGLPRLRILVRHLLPNVLGVVAVYVTLTVPAVILLESFLSFLGLGVQPPLPSWGSLLKQGADNMQVVPHLLMIPALFFSLTLFALNFLGDGLRDALDPQSSPD